MKSLVLAALAVAQAVPAERPADGDRRIFMAIGSVDDGGPENGGWFQFEESHQRFRLPPYPGDADTYLHILSAAAQRGVSLSVRYDATRGRVDADGAYVEYPLCSLSAANGASFGDERANCPPVPGARRETAESALALGLAMVGPRPAEARRRLGVAIDDAQLAPSLRAIALQERGEASEIIARGLPWAGADHDRALADALADYRRWAALSPDRPKPQYAIARALAGLGGYGEAMAIYRAIGQRWREEAFEVAIRTGALFRMQGLYAEALRAIDDFVAREGPRQGMRIHYHRGWTLALLGRPTEALEDLRQGLADQPDFPYAYFMRSCANAQLGQLSDALADQERGLELLSAVADEVGVGLTENLQTSRATVRTLRRLIETGRQRPTDVPCHGLWRRDVRTRPRSALLGPAPR